MSTPTPTPTPHAAGASAAPSLPTFETLRVTLDGAIARIELHRPDKANAIDFTMWQELRAAMHWLRDTPAARVAILSGAGRHFCAGIDLASFTALQAECARPCEARAREALLGVIRDIQDTVTAIERCPKPVIAAVHGTCVGGGIDLIAACDLRYCSAQAWFSVKEIDVALVADVGTLQRLPPLIGLGRARELAYTGRRVTAEEAQAMGLVNRCLADDAALQDEVNAVARTLAAKSPLALRGTKQVMTHARDHSVAESLEYVALWNTALLFSRDLAEVAQARAEGRDPVFDD